MAPDGWTQIRLGPVCTKIGSGATPRGGRDAYLQNGSYALIRSQNVYNDGFRREGLAFINESQAAELSNVEVEKDDVLVNITGDSVARCCQVDASVLPARVNQHVAIVRPDPKRLDPRLLRYLLVSPQMRAQLLSWAGSGGTRPALTKGMLESLEVVAPQDVTEQGAIAHILGTFDDKIELNRQMNEVIDELVLTEFQRRFSNSEGARETPLSKLMDLKRELVDPRAFPSESFDHYSLPAYDDGRVPQRQRGEKIKSVKFGVPDGAVLVSKLNPTIPRVWIPLPASPQVRRIASTEFMVLTPRPPLSNAFLYTLWRSGPLRQELTARVTGTSGSHQRVRPEDVLSVTVDVPGEIALVRFGEFATPLYQRYVANLQQSEVLAALRDALLPRLVSGEIRLGRGGRAEVAPAAP